MSNTANLIAAIAGLTLVSLAPACTRTASAEAAEDSASPIATASLTVDLSGIATPSGSINLVLFADQAGYDGNDPVRGARIEVTAQTASVTFDRLAPGDYAIKLYHDINGNNELDTNPFGMPTEPFAFSNNARGRFGPATWDKAVFDLMAGETTHSITVGG